MATNRPEYKITYICPKTPELQGEPRFNTMSTEWLRDSRQAEKILAKWKEQRRPDEIIAIHERVLDPTTNMVLTLSMLQSIGPNRPPG